MKTLEIICRVLCLFFGQGIIGSVLGDSNGNEPELYVAVGDRAIIKCPVDTESLQGNKIESIRWTKGSERTFVGQSYEDGSYFCINERYSMDNVNMNPLTLVISNTELSDTELYVCRIRSTESERFFGYVHFMVYEPFVLSIHVHSGNGWKEVGNTNSIINSAIGDDLRVRCTTVRQTFPIKLNWIELNDTIRSNGNVVTLGLDNEETIITELMIQDLDFHNEGVYMCKASYENSQQGLQQQSFSLKVTTPIDAVVNSSFSPSNVGRNLANLVLEVVSVMVSLIWP